RSQAIPVDVALLNEQPEVDRAEVADIVGEQWLLATRVRRLVAAEVRHRVVLVGSVDEIHAGLARLPGSVHDLTEHLAGVEPAYRRAGAGMDQVVGRTLFQSPHEGVRHGYRNVEVRHLG